MQRAACLSVMTPKSTCADLAGLQAAAGTFCSLSNLLPTPTSILDGPAAFPPSPPQVSMPVQDAHNFAESASGTGALSHHHSVRAEEDVSIQQAVKSLHVVLTFLAEIQDYMLHRRDSY